MANAQGRCSLSLRAAQLTLAFPIMPQAGNILVVDDNDDDVFFLEKAFKTLSSTCHFFRCIDGLEAQRYLRAEAPFSDRGFYPLPDLILLDLKIPHLNGFEVLEWIRADAALRTQIVVVLSSSSQQSDIDRAYALQANSFLTKPSSLAETVELARAIELCWLRALPTQPKVKMKR